MNKSLLCAGAAPNNVAGPPNATQMDLSNNLVLGLGNVVAGHYYFFETSLHGAAGGRTAPVPASFAAR